MGIILMRYKLITISFDETVYSLIEKYPDIKDIMVTAGFENITKPGMLGTVGKVMTIRKGARMKGIGLEEVKSLFLQHGYITEE